MRRHRAPGGAALAEKLAGSDVGPFACCVLEEFFTMLPLCRSWAADVSV